MFGRSSSITAGNISPRVVHNRETLDSGSPHCYYRANIVLTNLPSYDRQLSLGAAIL